MNFQNGDKLVYLGGSSWAGQDKLVEGELFTVAATIGGGDSLWVSRQTGGYYHHPSHFKLAKEHLFDNLYLKMTQ